MQEVKVCIPKRACNSKTTNMMVVVVVAAAISGSGSNHSSDVGRMHTL